MPSLADIVFPLRLSLQVAVLATVGVAVVGLPLAYFLATREFRGKGVVDVLVTLPLVLPPIVTGYYLVLLIGRNGVLGKAASAMGLPAPQLMFTWQAAALASFVIALPFTVKTAKAAFEDVDPALVATSYTLGRSELSTAFLVVAPLAIRGILAGLILSFARALGEFGATIMVAGNIQGQTNTMPLEIYNAVLFGDWRAATFLVVVFTLVSAAFLLGANSLAKVVQW